MTQSQQIKALRVAAQSALAALSQNKVHQCDINLAKSRLQAALEFGTITALRCREYHDEVTLNKCIESVRRANPEKKHEAEAIVRSWKFPCIVGTTHVSILSPINDDVLVRFTNPTESDWN